MGVLDRLGNKVRELRLSKGLSQEGLAERAGLHYTYVGGIERGERNPSLKSVEKIANALNVDIGELLFSQPKEKPASTEDTIRSEINELLKRKSQNELRLAEKVLKDVFEWAKERR